MNTSTLVRVWQASSIPHEWIKQRKMMRWRIVAELENYVMSIIEEVKKQGDAALIKFTEKFDGISLNAENLRVTDDEINRAYRQVYKKQISALRFLKKRVETFEKRLLERMHLLVKSDGVEIRCCTHPIQSVGCYVPGGGASYPSTLVMTAIPAKVAGVPRVVVCSPPTNKGVIHPLTLVAADLCGVDEIYKLGGPHAIAALAYGTESIRRVEKIVGPGNRYVMTAKILVSRDVPIDAPMGPSEILVLADETADPRIVALDMISQAEHSVEAVSGLVTSSGVLAKKVVDELEGMVPHLPRGAVVREALSRNGFVVICKTLHEMVEFINAFAPEHLEIIADNPMEIAEKIASAGLILIGHHSPVSASDYCFGVNHVLPTGGFSRIFSGLSVFDFVRRVNIVKCSKGGLLRLRDIVRTLAEAEGLPNHFLAVERRFTN